jgi:arabinose-5-phosphate isomerase
MALGDALAVALMRMRGFEPKDFALYHPGGYLGQRLLSKVKDMMHKRSDAHFPIISPTASMQETIWAMTHGRMGLALIMEDELLIGIITDGDLRRAMMNAAFSMAESTATDIMHWDPVTISQDAPWSEAEQIMSEKKIKAVVVLDNDQRVSGVVEIF